MYEFVGAASVGSVTEELSPPSHFRIARLRC
jgi:hypothetical protein